MSHAFVTVIVSPPFAPSLMLRLENEPLPGRPENYQIYVQRPAPTRNGTGKNPQNDGIEQEVWQVPVDLTFIEWFHGQLERPISLKHYRTFPFGLDLPHYEVSFGEWGHGARFEWSVPIPEGWESLAVIVAELLHRGRPSKYAYDY